MSVALNRRVLIVDDDPEIRAMLRLALDVRSLTIDEAKNGREAIEAMHAAAYSVILLDIAMPDVDGHAVLAALASTAAHNPVVLVISGADRSEIVRLDSRHIHGFVRKPFDPTEVAGLVETCIEVRERIHFDAAQLGLPPSGGTLRPTF